MTDTPDQVHTLLRVADLAKQWPHLRSVHDLAMSDLAVHEAHAKEELAKRAEVKAKAEAEVKAKADAKAKAEADAEAAREAKVAEALRPRLFDTPNAPLPQRRLLDPTEEQHR